MMDMNDIPNYRQFKVKFLAPTNHRGARVKIYEPKRFRDDKEEAITLSYDYAVGDILQQAINWLTEDGRYNERIIARCSEFSNYTLLVDSWGKDFKTLKQVS